MELSLSYPLGNNEPQRDGGGRGIKEEKGKDKLKKIMGKSDPMGAANTFYCGGGSITRGMPTCWTAETNRGGPCRMKNRGRPAGELFRASFISIALLFSSRKKGKKLSG